MGRVTDKISAYQQRHFEHLKKRNTGTVWLSKLINQLWLVMWQMWQHRNQVNNSGQTTHDKLTLQALQQQARKEFNLGTKGLPASDHHLLDDPVTVLDLDLPALWAWTSRLTNARACVARSTLRLRDRLKGSRRLLKRWLQQANSSES